jgi:serine/threonine-protein kinase
LHNEAKSVAALVHPHIVQVYEVGQREGRHYIAQEYVAGRNLKQQLTRVPSLDIEEVIRITRAVAMALGKAAALGIVHRDIKPENILLGEDGSVKVADFGLARKGPDHQQLELTQVGMTVGTPLYMSPEQIRGRSIGSLSDMYSLGITTYHMLAGHPPFEAATPLDVAMQHVNDTPTPLTEVRPDVPDALSRMVARMMEKRPADRFADFPELIEALDKPDWQTSSRRSGAARRDSSSLLSATRALAGALGGNTGGSQRRWLPSTLAAGLAGVALALFTGSTDPLAKRPGETLPKIERKESARAQHVYALLVNSEEAWKSVFEYFPEGEANGGERQRYYALNAKRQLARWYLDHDQLMSALPIFEKLAALDETDAALVAFGMAGQAIVHYQLGDHDQAASKIASLSEYRDELDDSLRSEVAKITRALGRD